MFDPNNVPVVTDAKDTIDKIENKFAALEVDVDGDEHYDDEDYDENEAYEEEEDEEQQPQSHMQATEGGAATTVPLTN